MSHFENTDLKETLLKPEEKLNLTDGPLEHHPDEQATDEHVEGYVYPSDLIDDLKVDVEQINDPEAKVHKVIEYMEKALTQEGTPHFRKFWQARSFCLELFKGHLNPTVRANLWAKYSELSKEVRKLKEVLDEQSAFAVEQIEIAIQGLESDIEKRNSEVHNEIKELFYSQALSDLNHYLKIQNELDHLNAFASKINSLRKELIKTEMRVRKKNKFFQRLSLAGDSVFPKRKELIKEISDKFSQDIEHFIKEHFSKDLHESLFALREEIKNLQGIAKILTLNTHAFTDTRLALSKSWEKLKEIDKERKKIRSEQKTHFKQNEELILKQLEEINALELPAQEVLKKLEEITSSMRKVELGKEELSFLREKIQAIRMPALEKMAQEEVTKKEQEKIKLQQKQQKILELNNQIEELISKAPNYDSDEIVEKRDSFLSFLQEAPISKTEKQELEKKLKPLKDLIVLKKEEKYLKLSENDRQSLEQLQEFLRHRKERRQEIKDQIENLRKLKGSSTLDFEKALEINKDLTYEKEQLDKINQAIQEMEEKIIALEESFS